MKKYYFAYNERYKVIHEMGYLWFLNEPTPEVLSWVEKRLITKSDEILEIGCGEGRDAIYLSNLGYKLVGVDASEEAIKKCIELANENPIEWIVEDALYLDKRLNRQFKWIYSIATLHMLVEDEERQMFLKSLNHLLDSNGSALLVIKGDGHSESKSDVSTAFDLQERNHTKTGQKVMVVGTSYRKVSWDTYEKELHQAGFSIESKQITTNNNYGQCMTVYLKKMDK